MHFLGQVPAWPAQSLGAHVWVTQAEWAGLKRTARKGSRLLGVRMTPVLCCSVYVRARVYTRVGVSTGARSSMLVACVEEYRGVGTPCLLCG